MLVSLVSGSDIGGTVSLSDSIDGRLGSGSGDSLVGIGDMLSTLGSGHGGCPPSPPSPLPPPPPSPPDTIGASLDSSPGKLSALNVSDPLVGAGDVLNSLETGGGVSEVSETTSLGGVIDCSWLGMGPMDSVDVFSEGMDAGLEVGGTLGCDVGDRLVSIEGNGLAADAEPADGGDSGEPLVLGPMDVVPELVPDGVMLLAIVETCELASGLADPLGLADDRRLDTGLTLAGGGGLPETGEGVDGVLLGIPDDNADGLPMLEITGLAADDASDGGRLSDDVPAELPTLTGEDCPELAVEGTLETPLGGDDPLGSDDAPEPLERLADDSDDSVPELSEPIDFVLCDDGWFDNDDGSDDCPDEPPLRESEDREPELPEGDDWL